VANARRQDFLANRLRVLLAGARLRDEGKADIRFQDVRVPLEALAAANPALDLTPPLEQAEPVALRAALASQPHIFHLVAHASFGSAPEQPGTIFLVNPAGYSAPVSAPEFATIFEIHLPDVVLLQMCEGAMSDPQHSFSDIAAHVVMQSVPVVIAMQFEISVASASTFAQAFYAALLQAADVEYAVQAARRAVVDKTGGHELRDYATPVVYTSLETPLGYRFLGAPTIDAAFIAEHYDSAVLRIIRQDDPVVEKQGMLKIGIRIEAKSMPTPDEWADAFRNLNSTHLREIALRAGLDRRESAELLAVRDDQQLVQFIQTCDRLGKLDDLRQALTRVIPGRHLPDSPPVEGYITVALVKPDAPILENGDLQVALDDWLVSLHLND
jgi:hypothetical protein